MPDTTHRRVGPGSHIGRRTLPIIEDHITWMALAGMSPRTMDARRQWLYRLDAALPYGVGYASPGDLTQAIAAFARRAMWSRQTLATYSRHTRGFYRWAIEAQRLAPPDPSAGLPRPSVPPGTPRPVRDDVLAVILQRSEDPYRIWALLAAFGGLRCIEISRLSREDIDAQGIRVYGKGDRPAWVPMHQDIWAAVRDLPPGPIARRPRDRAALPAHEVSRTWQRHVKRFGVDAGLHQLRHWFGSEALRQCGNVRTVQKLLRHASIASTVRYTEISTEELVSAIKSLRGVAR